MPFRLGLCSVTLRARPWRDVLQTAVVAGLDCVEWGGDSHIAPGDFAGASGITMACQRSSREIASYGSYYRAGHEDLSEAVRVVRTAAALQAPRIRIWAGRHGSTDTSPSLLSRVVGQIRDIADVAAIDGMTIGLEYHEATFTDSPTSTARLLDMVDRHNVRTYWQPPIGMDADAAMRISE